jgi:hypothetical protein
MLGREFQLDVHTVCVLLPPLPQNGFPSIQGVISLLKYQTLRIIQDGNRNQNFKFSPDQKGQIPVLDKNLYSPSPSFYGMEKFIGVPLFILAFQCWENEIKPIFCIFW